MTIKILAANRKGKPILCRYCNIRMIKTPEQGTDYYICMGALILQSFCPKCGRMIPFVEKNIVELSNNKKHKLTTAVCNSFNLGYSQIKNISNDIKNIRDYVSYVEHFSTAVCKETDKSYDEVYSFCMKYINN